MNDILLIILFTCLILLIMCTLMEIGISRNRIKELKGRIERLEIKG